MDYMEVALSLAKLAQGQVSPNPAVGAVIVKDDVILSMGYTQPAGGAHAEVVALKGAGRDASGATMYVTLEPHCYQKPHSSLHPGDYSSRHQRSSFCHH